ncbi:MULTISPECIES: serine hydrolase domain-containing protein [unclassified Bosea (in: a-proteobacteria)]|uniref:serine hydrolase domain-containing protein n=1 Tax=unclassified Bosea (in: a-proteobacteria) TaxID=2653178 RepID=UPI000F753C96|nr:MULTISPECIES: serine hydrolase domain-containing protein [unclassified Bosea (in: a-proteobacteria)]AZO79496.1 serine hydrolase [Bosea sp. Tri-49]RXT16261.1 serine hydrolase [Bosea sp. Tri-39]RXT39954.1 serine hydrolase [Bosea sp. Tri-54]
MVDWTKGRAEAQAIAEPWTRQGGPGGAVVLFDRDGVRESASGGFSVIEHRLPFTADTQNRLASISKHICATLLLREGVSLEATLGSFLPELPKALGVVTLCRALDMTGALPDTMEALWQQGTPFTASLSAAEVFAAACRLPGLNAEPGTEMAYSNTGWRLAQAILERRTGKGAAQLVEELMAPGVLPIRFVSDESEVVPGLATGYWHDGQAWRRGFYGFNFSASGGMAGSAAGLARWAAGLMAGHESYSGLLDKLIVPRQFADGSESLYRLGLVATQLGDTSIIGHGGSLTGYRNHMLMAPDEDVGVVVLTNREEDALWPALRVLAALTGEALPGDPERIPNGLYATEEGPFWAEFAGGAISFMGGYEKLVSDNEGGMRSLPAYLDVRLKTEGDGALAGKIGGVARRLLPVPAETKLDERLVGRWRDNRLGVEITIRADGTASWPWAGAIGRETRLTPLPGGRALADLMHGPWRHRPCLWLQPDGSLRLAGHRSRILHFHRIEGGQS